MRHYKRKAQPNPSPANPSAPKDTVTESIPAPPPPQTSTTDTSLNPAPDSNSNGLALPDEEPISTEQLPSDANPTLQLPRRRREHSPRTRQLIISLSLLNRRPTDISRECKVPKSTVTEVLKRYRSEGLTAPRPRTGRPKKLSQPHVEAVLRIADRLRGRTIMDITAEVMKELDMEVSDATVGRVLRQSGVYARKMGAKAGERVSIAKVKENKAPAVVGETVPGQVQA